MQRGETRQPVKVFWTEDAELGLRRIFAYTALFSSEAAADRLVDQVLKRIDLLAYFPLVGKRDPVIGKMDPNLRFINKGKIRIVYEIGEGCITILNLINSKTNPNHWNV